MGIKGNIALGIAGVYYIYPPCYAICCYRVLYSCYTTSGLALGLRADIALCKKGAIYSTSLHNVRGVLAFLALALKITPLKKALCQEVLYRCYTAFSGVTMGYKKR